MQGQPRVVSYQGRSVCPYLLCEGSQALAASFDNRGFGGILKPTFLEIFYNARAVSRE
jgi:hypothetical protein